MPTNDAPLQIAALRSLSLELGQGGGQVTVTGEGFGPAPNVILWRTFREGVGGAQIQAAAPDGEVGTLSAIDATDKYANFKGRTVFQGFDGQNKAALEFIAPQVFSGFRHSVAIAVPDGSQMPGDNVSAERQFPTDSGWKPVWVMLSDNGNGTGQAEPDICLPTHIGGGVFSASGNSVAPDFTRFISGGTQATWRWDELNLFDYVQVPSVTGPKSENGYLEARVTDGSGTSAVVRNDVAVFAGTDASVTDAVCYYDRVKYNAYANNKGSSGSAQAYLAGLYLAVESAPGANDYRQCAFVGNAATFENCTELWAVKADSWSDTAVTITNHYGVSHYHIVKPDGSIVSGEF